MEAANQVRNATRKLGGPDVTLYLIRHGQSMWNAEGRIQGQVAHVPLTCLGRQQAETAAQSLRPRGIVAIYSSDLVRAWQTADTVARVLEVEARPSAALRERHLGNLQGRVLASGASEQDFGSFDSTSADLLQGAEELEQVHRRVGGLLQSILDDPPGPAIAVISHGIAIRMCVAWLMRLSPDDRFALNTNNGSVTAVRLIGRDVVNVRTETPDAPTLWSCPSTGGIADKPSPETCDAYAEGNES